MVDVTHHKVAELEIADSEARYRLLAQNVTDMIVTTDLTGRILYSSPSCQSVMGYSPVELICTKAVDRTHPDDVAEMVRVFTAVAAGAPPERLRWRGKHKLTGDWIWLESKPSLIRDPETGAPSGFLDVIRDVSEQQAAEALIAESEGRYRLLAENVTDMIVTSTLDGRTSYVSPAAAKLTGYTVEEATGVRTLDLVHPDDGPVMIKAFRALVSGAAAERIRWRGKHKSGGWTWLESMPALVTDGLSGEPAGFVDVVRDVTAQVTQEEALLEARAVAEAATAVKTEFLANMSHELRTPLTSILGFAELLRGHVSPGGEGSRYLDRVAGASSALMSIVNDILDFSKLEAGQVEVELRPVDPAALFEGVVQLLAPQANEKDVTLSFCADASVPEVGLMDDTRVRQVLLNLMSNAVKFTACGEVRVTLTSRDGATIRCEVSDTGPGIPRDRLDRLFQRFSQVDASTTRAFGGTGLGLAICKGLVEAMGGRIGVESCVGRGSTFWFELGCEKADLAPTSAAAGFAQDMSGFGLAGLRVLVADDNPVNRELVRLYLTAADIEVTDVASGEDAVEAAMAAPFDLIMMDIRMPGAGGPVSAKRIREERGPNDITPIIAFTADADTGSMPAEWGHAFNDRVGKPIVAAELFSVLARWGLGSELAPQLAIAHV
jgi:PAS domain S-box-containing protein